MDISNFSVEDFVLDARFRSWVLKPTSSLNEQWDSRIAKHPAKVKDIVVARELVLKLAQKNTSITKSEIQEMWEGIDGKIDEEDQDSTHEPKVIYLNSASVISQYNELYRPNFKSQWKRVAAILAICFGLSVMANLLFSQNEEAIAPVISFTEFSTPPGVKSSLRLSDGSVIKLNSGSRVRYMKDFTAETREVFLEGEAYFEVAKDAARPFIVHTGNTSTTALGTSFNIRSYEGEEREVALLTGKVAVMDNVLNKKVYLKKGDGVKLNPEKDKMELFRYNKEITTAWLNKKIIFDKTPINEMVRTLENWYGVKISLSQINKTDLWVSGTYTNETLSNILEGLSYTARFDYEINDSDVKIKFKQ